VAGSITSGPNGVSDWSLQAPARRRAEMNCDEEDASSRIGLGHRLRFEIDDHQLLARAGLCRMHNSKRPSHRGKGETRRLDEVHHRRAIAAGRRIRVASSLPQAHREGNVVDGDGAVAAVVVARALARKLALHLEPVELQDLSAGIGAGIEVLLGVRGLLQDEALAAEVAISGSDLHSAHAGDLGDQIAGAGGDLAWKHVGGLARKSVGELGAGAPGHERQRQGQQCGSSGHFAIQSRKGG
jgi:hypothetical protein